MSLGKRVKITSGARKGCTGRVVASRNYPNMYNVNMDKSNKIIPYATNEFVVIPEKRCSDIKPNESVVFLSYSEIFKKNIPTDGIVVFNRPERKTICVSYLEGYKDITAYVSYEDMIAVYDENGVDMKFENISGKSIMLTAE